MAPTATRLSDAARDVLSHAVVSGSAVELRSGQLDRKLYLEVNTVLEALGGDWNRKLKAHLFPLDADALADRLAEVVETGEILTPKNMDYYSTPPALAARIIELARIQPGHLVLEPSAGTGALADLVACLGAAPVCVEVYRDRAAVLREKGYETYCADFLDVPVVPMYDRIVMNPPFSKRADLVHVERALQHLAPGGRLVAIMSGGLAFRSDARTAAFRALLGSDAEIESNPDDAFKSAGTSVRTLTVAVQR